MVFTKRHIMKTLKIGLLLVVAMVVIGLGFVNFSGHKLLSVQTGSMAPAIKQGDLVSVNRVPLDELSEGDVITFVSPDGQRTITHRIVTLLPEDPAGNNVITKGDANAAADAPIEASSVVGKVQRHVPYAGHVLDFMYSWPGLILLIYIPALAIIVSETRRLAAYYRSLRYALPEWLGRHTKRSFHAGRSVAFAGAVGLALLSFALPVKAALQQTAHLTGNTITSTGASVPLPEPEPEPAPKVEGAVSLRRVFIVCGEEQDAAASVHIIMYNSSRLDADVSGWALKSSDKAVLTLPPDSVVRANSTFDTRLPIPENISYASGTLTLYNQDDEQISKTTWEPQTRGDRECRTTSDRDDSGEVDENSRASSEDRN